MPRFGFHNAVTGFLVLLPIALFAVQVHDDLAFAARRVGYTVSWEGVEGESGPVVVEIDEGLAAGRSGMRLGDRLLAIDGRPATTREAFLAASEQGIRPRQPSRLTLERDGQPLTVTVVPGAEPRVVRLLLNGAGMLLFLAAGVVALWKSPTYLNGHLAFLLFVATALELAEPAGLASLAVQNARFVFLALLTGIQLSLELHLVATFPRRPRWLERRPWVVPTLYAVGIGLGLFSALATFDELFLDDRFVPWTAALADTILFQYLFPLWPVALLVGFAVRAVTFAEAEGRLQAGLVFLGALPWSVYAIAATVAPWLGQELPADLDAFAPVLFGTMPLSVLAILWREGSRQRRLVFDFLEDLDATKSPVGLLGAACRHLQEAFHPEEVYMLHASRGARQLSVVCSAGAGDGAWSAEDEVYWIDRLRTAEGPLRVQPRSAADPVERRWVEDRRIRVAIPLRSSEDVLQGMVLLGDKTSGEPYTPQNLRVLHSLARQLALQIDRSRLQEEVSHGRQVQREVLDHLHDRNLNLVKECPLCGRCFDRADETCPLDGLELRLTVPVERVLADRYRLDRRIGRGGMGAVFLGTDERLRRSVAVKVLLGSQLGSPEALRRFRREARIAARLRHPNIITVHDFGETETGGAFLVMEHLEGLSLREALERYGTLDPAAAADWFDQVLAGLQAAHNEHVVHRDLSPGNVFLAREEGEPRAQTVKILDFGVAKVEAPGTQTLGMTAPGTLLGTPDYMAPEQLTDGPVTEAADLWAVGVMVAESLTGRRPFHGATTRSLTTAILTEHLDLGSQGAAALAVERILQRCLAKSPEDRYPSAEALRRDLVPALRALPPTAWRSVEPAGGGTEVILR